MKLTVTLPESAHQVEFDESYGQRTLTVDGKEYDLSLLRTDLGRVRYLVDGVPTDALITGDLSDLTVDAGSGPVDLRVEETRLAAVRKLSGMKVQQPSARNLRAPMPGLILRVLVTEDQNVEEGTPLLIIEAMKMQNELRAEEPGRVTDILVEVGQAVEKGAMLVKFAFAHDA